MSREWAIPWLIIAVIVAFVVGSLNLPLLGRLVTDGVQAQATIVELTPKIHNTVRYEYQVGSQKFEGQGRSWRPNPPIDEIHVGQSLVIYYDPSNPSRSVLGDPKPMLTNEIISVGIAVLLIPTFIVFAIREKYRKMVQPS